MGLACYYCGGKIEENNLGRQDTCPACSRDTRVCKNCMHYDPSLHNECRENQAERVVDKEKSNFCSWFKVGKSSGGVALSKEELRKKAEALFKKASR